MLLTVREYPAPRWSVVRPAGLLPLSMHGLPASRAWVGVGPPLSASGPRFRAAPKGKLLPWSTNVPMKLPLPIALVLAVTLPGVLIFWPLVPAVFPEMIVLSIVTLSALMVLIPPPYAFALLA